MLPAHAPINISNTRINLETSGHASKSTVENPVVVMIEATWKEAWRREEAILETELQILMVMIPIDANIIKK